MKYIMLMASVFLITSCTTLPQLYQSLEDIANDDGIDITISREAIQKKKDVNVNVQIQNSDK